MAIAPEVEHLRAGIAGGQPAAYQALMRALAEPLFRYAAGIIRDEHAAEEVVQMTFLRVFKSRRRLAQGTTLRGFCYRVAHNLSLNHARDERMRRERESRAVEMRETKSADPEFAALAHEAWRLAEELPEDLRSTLHLRYGHGLTLAETAHALDIPEGTVSTRQRTALQKLRERLALSVAVVPGIDQFGSTLGQSEPAPIAASNKVASRVEAVVMASIGAKSTANVFILAMVALLLLLGGASVAWVFLTDDPQQPKIAGLEHPTGEVEEQAPDLPAAPAPPPEEVLDPPKEAAKPEEPEDDIDRLELLRQLKARYDARDKPGFAEATEKCKAAQPWDFEILLPFFKEVTFSEFKRWRIPFKDQKTGQIVMVDDAGSWGAELTLERAIIGLAMDRIALEEDGVWLCAKAREWILKTAASTPQVEAKKKQQFGGLSAPVNPDAEALGVFAGELLNHSGYEASRAFVASIFSYVKKDDALRWGLIQIRLCEAIGAAKVEAAAEAVDQLYIAAERAAVKHAAFNALIQIKGEQFAAQEAKRILELFPSNKPTEKAMATLRARFEVFVVACPSGEMMLGLMDELMAKAENAGMRYFVGTVDTMHVLNWRRYRQVDPRDEKLLMLEHFDKTKLLGVVRALAYEIGDAYEGTNDAYARRVLADKIDTFEGNGWTGNIYDSNALSMVIGAYSQVSIDPAESLNMFLNVWYPQHHSWALATLDDRLRGLLAYQLGRAAVWGPTHDRAFEALCQRIKGKGELAYSGPMKNTKNLAESLSYVKFPEMKQALIEKVQTTEDATARKVYEDALAEWCKRNEK